VIFFYRFVKKNAPVIEGIKPLNNKHFNANIIGHSKPEGGC
jgi:hypothetical protein